VSYAKSFKETPVMAPLDINLIQGIRKALPVR